MRAPIKRNPLGIRKLDVQAIRRQRTKEHKAEAKRAFEFWFAESSWRTSPIPLTPENVTRCIEAQMHHAWEQGVSDGAKATRDRVAESLENGKLIKP